jgi:hypothetical protein
MTVKAAHDGAIELAGACPAEDAERLLRLLLERPGSTVDWRSCDEAHAAVVQVLLASAAPLRGPPSGEFLGRFVAPLLGQAEVASPADGSI